MQTRNFFRAALCVALFSVAASAQPVKHELKLGRSIKEYDRYLLKTTFENVTKTKLYISDVLRGDSTDRLFVILNAQCEVISVTVDGQEKEKRLVIRDFRRMTQRDTVDLLPTGTKLRCWFSDSGSVYTVNDAPAPDSLISILGEVIKGEGGSRTGNVLDAKKPVAVGGTWKMNIPAFRKVLGPEMSRLMKKITGSVTFASIDSSGAMPTATVTARAEAPTFTMVFGDAPSKASLVADFSLIVPLDTRFPPAGITTSSTQKITTTQDVARMEFEISMKRSALFLR
ncbi:MAG TPA: hypothetical protein VK147_00765 [Candidatus Didemnitutus sp.]|nr:hypothetical protein [Candidatus Didemnitutus sp.]